MTDKKKAKTAEVEGLIVKIGVDVDKAAIAEATAALKELAEAANQARDALNRLTGRKIGGYLSATGGSGGAGGGGSQLQPGEGITVVVGAGSGARPGGKKFKL
ncbi:hypothetical protein [Rhizobium sp. 11515TR]|uniref:hypothetical protein n=1 Tax=Rhizobium sp. 11515TR TaxID=2028343 RepID=UPI000BA853F6|nr:hypothetical protein [Rhizobium sp. 11515TR]ASW06291.1 hypothetical protein CKA34_10620 [Rhizobium sp. 11515TR]